MSLWSVVFFVAAAAVSVSAKNEFAYPEDVRGSSRIVSGWEATEGQIPHQLSLRMVNAVGGVTACGGSIIHPEWGITAAHCTALRVSIVVRAGTVNLTQPEIIFDTTEYYNHPEYIEALQSVVQPNDIGLLRFGRAITYSNNVQPIRIQSSFDKNRDYGEERLVASGWGLTWTQGSSPENMNWVYLKGETNWLCWLAFGGSNIIQDSTICASGYNVSSQSTCQGDSGGPLTIIDQDNQLTLVGVTSFVSSSGCHTDLPAGFVRPGFYHDWYTQVTGINFDWDPSATTTAAPEVPSTVEPDTTVAPDIPSTVEPEVDVTTPEPELDVTTPEPEVDVTTPEPEVDGTTPEPEADVTTPEPEVDGTTPEPEADVTTPEPEVDGTTPEPEADVTTPEPEADVTTPEPEVDATTPEPEVDATTLEPEVDTTTTEPEDENTEVIEVAPASYYQSFMRSFWRN